MNIQFSRVRVSEIGEYIRHHSCERRFKLEINNRAESKTLPFANRLFNALDPVLQEAGRARENAWESSLLQSGVAAIAPSFASSASGSAASTGKATATTGVGSSAASGIVNSNGGAPFGVTGDLNGAGLSSITSGENTSWASFRAAVEGAAVGQNVFGREVEIAADIGAFDVEGRVDFLLLLWEDGKPLLRIVECKASRKDRTYQRVQVALYRMMVRQMLESQQLLAGGVPLSPNDVECVVARIEEDTNQSQSMLDLPSLDSEMEEADIERLLDFDGPLLHIANTPLNDLAYQLDAKCDGCVFNVHCLPESARLRRHELLGVSPSTARALRDSGILTLDALADLDLDSTQATQTRQNPDLSESLELLVARAKARRTTLPNGGSDPDAHEVTPLPQFVQSQLPMHEIPGAEGEPPQRLVRVYLCVDYDYTENRIGALSAHVTRSDGSLRTGWLRDSNDKAYPDPKVKEALPVLDNNGEPQIGADGRPIFQEQALQGKEVARLVASPWTGDYRLDTGAEKELLQGFLMELVEAIAEVAEAESAPIHFYVWSRNEMRRLVEACARVDSRLLSHLRELLGCRESLEQLIFSSLGDEVNRRYALGWTGRGLAVATSLRWFGQVFHWTRRVAGAEVRLDRVMQQDIFDFKTDLELLPNGQWNPKPKEGDPKHKFEIRARFQDALTAPYWRAYWGTLPDPDKVKMDAHTAGAIRRYKEASAPGVLKAYLSARCHALRWIEERVRFKSEDIIKPSLNIAELVHFDLGVHNAAQAGVDFLRLDQHVKVAEWVSDYLAPLSQRVSSGRTVPVRDVEMHDDGTFTAQLDMAGQSVSAHELSSRCSLGPDSFVRLSPRANDPHRGQTFKQLVRGGKTARVTALNWHTGEVSLEIVPGRATRYTLGSIPPDEPGLLFDFATLDESVSDFVASKVEKRLLSNLGSYAYDWLDPLDPQMPEANALAPDERVQYENLLASLPLPGGHADADQIAAALDGLETRVQLLQGPPGTGKTQTTALAVLLRVMTRLEEGSVVLVGAPTHTAVDTLLERIGFLVDNFRSHIEGEGYRLPSLVLSKVVSGEAGEPSSDSFSDFGVDEAKAFLEECGDSVLIVGGTTSALLKLADRLNKYKKFRLLPDGFQTPVLIVDEASMMVFPHFLALATLVQMDGSLMLAGDHRQLSPIVAHDWENEDRPPSALYQPFVSAYEAVRRIAESSNPSPHTTRRSTLSYSFRLPPLIRDLLTRLYSRDDITLTGPCGASHGGANTGWQGVWDGETGLYLVLHSERASRQSNALEVEIIRRILAANPGLSDDSVAVVTPHRAQRALLRRELQPHLTPNGPVGVIDTVERLQGGERPVVIVSATASEPTAIDTNASFILDLNRSNVAFSRAKERLIVVCSESLLGHIPVELEHYEAAMLWKSLRALCSRQVAHEQINGHTVHVMAPALEGIEEAIEESL